MLLKLLISPLWVLLDLICSFLPEPTIKMVVNSSIFDLLSQGIAVVGVSNFVMMMGSVLFWYTVQLTWAVIEWIYRKIPGVS